MVDFSSLRFSACVNSIKLPSSLIIFKAVEWKNFGLLVLNSDLISLFVDVLLGGKVNSYNHKHDHNRILTVIEQGIARQISEVLLSELSASFDHRLVRLLFCLIGLREILVLLIYVDWQMP